MQRIFYGVQIFMKLLFCYLEHLRFPKIRTCETTDELGWVTDIISDLTLIMLILAIRSFKKYHTKYKYSMFTARHITYSISTLCSQLAISHTV